MPEQLNQPEEVNNAALVELLVLAGRLKRLVRQGWLDRGVAGPESVADHSFRLAFMTLLLAQHRNDIDVQRAVTLALLHDLPEAITGDVTPFDDRRSEGSDSDVDLYEQMPTYSEEARRRKTMAERLAIETMTGKLAPDLARLISDAWEEYESGETAEALFVRQLDKLETWLQALEYQNDDPALQIGSFEIGTTRDVTDDELVEIRRAIDRHFRGADNQDRAV